MFRPTNIRNQNGQTMVEFTIVLPILLTFLFGIMEFGIVFNNYVTLTDAVRAGARKAAVSRQAADPVGTTLQAFYDAATDLNKSKLQPPPTVASTWQHGDPVTVCAFYPYDINVPFLGIHVVHSTLKSCTKERVE